MRKTLWILTVVAVFVISQIAVSAEIQTDAELKAKLEHKVAQMKAEGASPEEIGKFVGEFEKKVAVKKAKHLNKQHKKQEHVMQKVSALETELKKKIKKMKAAGAAEKEINKVIADYRVKIEKEMKAAGAPETAIKKVIAYYDQMWMEEEMGRTSSDAMKN